MLAASIERLGGPGEIHVGELPDPVVTAGHVLVRVAVTVVDPVDLLIRSGRYRTPLTFPFVVGRDLVGTVVEVGDRDGHDLAVGDLVWCNSMGHDGRPGPSSELVSVPADRLYRLPADVDLVTAVAVLHPAATAATAFLHHARLRAGETVLVHGGNGSVGGCAIQVAAALGATVIATARGADAVELARANGAHHVIDAAVVELPVALAELAPDGVDVDLDTTGHLPLDDAVAAVRPRGRVLVMTGVISPQPLTMLPMYSRDVALLGFAISQATVAELADAARLMNELLAAGRLRTRVASVRPLAAIAEAHAELEAHGQPDGRLVIDVGGVPG